MKKTMLTVVFAILGIAMTNVMNAQDIKKTEKKIRLKFVEEHDGIKTEIDTMLLNPSQAEIDAVFNKYHIEGEAAKNYEKNFGGNLSNADIKKILKEGKSDGSTVIYKNYKEGDKLPEDILIMLDTLAVTKDGKNAKMIVVDINNEQTSDGKGKPTITKTIIIKKVMLKDLSKDELLSQKLDASKQQLKVSQINLYPNPNNGLMKLSFSLPGKGNTAVSIVNKDGKIVYEEQLKDFTGNYEKEINLSGEEKGFYYLKVQQGEKLLYKKIVIE